MAVIKLPSAVESVGEGMSFIEKALQRTRINRREIMKTMLIAEEWMVRLIEADPSDGEIWVNVRARHLSAQITLSAHGEKIAEDVVPVSFDAGDEISDQGESSIRALLLRAFRDKIAYSNRNGFNYIRIRPGVPEQIFLVQTVQAFIAALAVSFVMVFLLPDRIAQTLAEQVMRPIQTLFLNALQMVTAPAVFFSIMTCVARYVSIANSGRISTKVFASFIVTSLESVLLGFGLFRLFRPLLRRMDILPAIAAGNMAAAVSGETLGDWIADLVPNNVITPFLNTDTLQLLVIAVLGGVALCRAGQYAPMLQEIADALERFFTVTVRIVNAMIPVAVFFTTLLLILELGYSSIAASFSVLGLTLLGMVCLLLLYLLLIWIVGRANPILFLRKYAPQVFRRFFRGSSVDDVSDTMKFCKKKLGIASKVSSFSIPFGSVANLDGNCVYLTIAGLFLASLCGVDVPARYLVVVMFMVFILSIGSPITPGSALLALAALMEQVGASVSAISIILCIDALMEVVLVMFNTIGDVATTLIVARTEKLVDMDVYNNI